MALSSALVERLTPSIPAPGEDEFLKDKFIKEIGRQRRLAWTRYLRSEELFYKQIAPAIPKGIPPWHVGVGLVPTLGFSIEAPKTMASAVEESGYTWGVFLALEAFASASAIQTTLDFQRRDFPIAASPSTVQLHDLTLGSTHNSAIGSRTTWATARQVTRQGRRAPLQQKAY